jgi:hypothetical protein
MFVVEKKCWSWSQISHYTDRNIEQVSEMRQNNQSTSYQNYVKYSSSVQFT